MDKEAQLPSTMVKGVAVGSTSVDLDPEAEQEYEGCHSAQNVRVAEGFSKPIGPFVSEPTLLDPDPFTLSELTWAFARMKHFCASQLDNIFRS